MYYDGTTDNNLRYYGSTPNNYITFNGELWRIIGVMNNMTTSDGKSASLVKIVRASSIGTLAWDSTNVNDWSSATLKNMLNSGAYYNKNTGTDTQYNPSFQSISVDYTSNGLTSLSKKMIASVAWKLGGWNTNAVTSTNMYSYERGTTVYSGHSTSWTGQVGLMYASDYGFASSACYNNKTLDTYSTCSSSNWLYSGYDEWLLTPMSGYVHSAYRIMSGNLNYYAGSGLGCNGGYSTRPSLYLNSNILLNGGDGTSSNPYTIMNPVNNYDYTGGEQTFVVPTDGYYTLEAWGAGAPGLGGYTSGSVYLTANTNLYINVGGTGGNINYSDLSTGGYNGGGYGAVATFSGGGATDFRLTSGNLYSRIMVAGGAGGKGNYTNSSTYGGYGGGIDGGAGYLSSIGSTQVSGASFGTGIGGHSNNGCGGAGGGYYGGTSNCSSTSMYAGGGGGSAFVSGYTGCVAVTSSSSLTPRLDSKGVQCTEASAASDITCSYHYSGYIFKNGIIKAGNTVMPTHDGTSTMTGNSGNGYAKITYIGTTLK